MSRSLQPTPLAPRAHPPAGPARRAAAALLLTTLLPSPARAAADTAALEARIEAQDARIRQLEAAIARLTAAPPATTPSSTGPAPGQTATGPAPVATTTIATADTPGAAPATADPITIKLRGRLQVEALLLNRGDGATPTGTQVRRLYLGAEGKLPAGFRYQAEADFAGNRVSLQDALVAYQAGKSTEIIAGYFKPQVTQDDTTSDVYTLFLERSAYAGVFAPGRRVGLGFNHAGKNWGLGGGVFGERDDATLDGDRAEAWVASLRGHADLLPGDDTLHLALSTYYTEPSRTDGVALSQKPEANRAVAAISTGTFAADHGLFFGGEIGWGSGPFTVQAEGGTLKYEGPLVSPRFTGWSAQASWRLTGEPRPYDGKVGIFGRVKPAHGLDDGGLGAIEAGVRVTGVDLSDDLIAGGRLTSYGAVLNWYPLQRLRISANVIHASVARPGVEDEDQTSLSLRGGIDW